jgi:nitrogen fixation NifU-like protein
MIYSEKVMEHFQNPRNVGTMEDADGIGQVGNPVCGDMMTFYVKVADSRITDVKFQTFGCGAAIAVSSMVSEMAIGKTVEEALQITNESVAEELGGLPKNKMHCSNLGADALHLAIENYQEKHKAAEGPASSAEKAEESEESDSCACPYCEGPIEGLESTCQSCHVEFEDCPECLKPMNKKADDCPHCGATKPRI